MRRLLGEFIESVRIALEQIRAHKMRAALTALGVVIGVLAVTLMGTAVKGIQKGFNDSLNMIGTDGFWVNRRPWRDVGDDWHKYAVRPNLTVRHAERMDELIREVASGTLEVAVPESGRWRTVRQGRNTVENVEMIGTTSEYMRATAYRMGQGRFFSAAESRQAQNVVVLGAEVADALFPEGAPLGRRVIVDEVPFSVIGVMERQGDFLGMMSMDRRVTIPYPTFQKIAGRNRDLSIVVKKKPEVSKQEARDVIEDLMRRVRGLEPEQENDFEINSTDIIEEQMGPILSGVAIAGLGITGMSLFVGAIGIMNITFVSVRERTREIGTRRALGAPRRAIVIQFLMEAVSICVLGGVVGLTLTYTIRNIVAGLMPQLPLVFSGDLIVLALILSVGVGILSGIVPAWAASRLDPATALRHD